MTEPRQELVAREDKPSLSPPDEAKVEEFAKESFLTAYIDHVASSDFTEEAKAALLLEVRQYARDVCTMANIQRRSDGDAEKVLRSHVVESAGGLRNKQESFTKTVADWSKWIGFTWLGLTVQQWISVSREKPIVFGSVAWLVADVILCAVFIIVGFAIEKPLGAVAKAVRRR